MTRMRNARGRIVRSALVGLAITALGLSVLDTSSTTQASAAAPPGDGRGQEQGRDRGAAVPGNATPPLTRRTFAEPPTDVRPMYRYWMPLAYADDDVLRSEVEEMARAGAGGFEVAPFIVAGSEHQTNEFLAEYGWGTPQWAHKMEVVTQEAAAHGLSVDQNLGPHYPPTVPTLNSFNQRAAEQTLVYGREFSEPGTTRRGALPGPTTPPPSVTTELCAAAAPDADVLGVRSLGGFAPGDEITVGSGESAEQVVVEGLGDRTAECGELSITPVMGSHEVGATVMNVARTTRVRTLVAQCADACGPDHEGSIALVPSSVGDVTAAVSDGALEHSFEEGNGHPWVLLDFQQTASGLIAQRGGFTATQPNYVVDHWSRDGVEVQAAFWDEHVLTRKVRANLRRTGGAVFEDSLELGEKQKWTWGLLEKFEERRGYDATTLLPALADVGVQGDEEPAFELPGVGPKVREDYRRTLSDLYNEEYVRPMQRWARGHGLDFRAQAYGTPIATAEASAEAGIPEGESLNFGSGNPVGAEQNYRVVSGGAHLSGRGLVSVECCAAFFGNYRSSLAGPDVPGGFGEGGDGSAVGGKYSQGLLDSIHRAYAGGVNQLVWHGFAYRDAPPGDGTAGRDGGTWPGYNPWDIFGLLNASETFGPRQASWADYSAVNDSLARTQLALRQGKSVVDVGVYYEDLGLKGSSVSSQQTPQHMLPNDSATAQAGYTYEYVAPRFLAEPGLRVERDGGLFGDRSDHAALILNDQRTIELDSARRLLTLAEQGLRIFVVGEPPTETTGADPHADQLDDLVDELLAQGSVVRVEGEAQLPDALSDAGIEPAVRPVEHTAALGLVRREAKQATYDFVHNRSGETVEQDLTLTGRGTPYLLDTWTGEITPIAEYSRRGDQVTVPVRLAPHDKTIIALLDKSARWGKAPRVHAEPTAGEVRADGKRGLTLRASEDGRYTVPLSNGTRREIEVSGLPEPQMLDTWTLAPQTWEPGEHAYTTHKVDHDAFEVTAGTDGSLPSWREISEPVDLSHSSGIGTYTTRVDLPETWRRHDGAYLDLGDVLDSASVWVNGEPVVVNQSDRGRIDLGHRLQPGENTIEVRVATTLFNAVRSTGDSNYQRPDWQRTGLMGPVVLTPYRETKLLRR